MTRVRPGSLLAALVTGLALVAPPVPPVTATGSAPAATALPAAAPHAAVTAGRSAWVAVSVARLWRSPTAPRAVDRPALAAPVRFRAWLRAMSLDQRRALASRSDTEALLGDRVVVRRVSGAWARVVVPDQPTPKDPGGYPGWVPLRQLTGVAPQLTARVATVVRRTAWLRRDDSSRARITEISSGSRLPVLGRSGTYLRVRPPGSASRLVALGAVVVHDRGTPALPPHRGVATTARGYVGLAYLWGGLSGFGLDCSGLTWLSFRLHGTRIPRDSLPQSQGGTRVVRSALRPADLLFYATAGRVHHVAMYVGAGRMVEAPHTGALVRVVPVRWRGYYGARRY